MYHSETNYYKSSARLLENLYQRGVYMWLYRMLYNVFILWLHKKQNCHYDYFLIIREESDLQPDLAVSTLELRGSSLAQSKHMTSF